MKKLVSLLAAMLAISAPAFADPQPAPKTLCTIQLLEDAPPGNSKTPPEDVTYLARLSNGRVMAATCTYPFLVDETTRSEWYRLFKNVVIPSLQLDPNQKAEVVHYGNVK